MFPLPGLRQARLRRLLSQERLAHEAGMSETTVVKIEQGRPARLSTIRKLADVLKVEPDELMREPADQGQQEAAA